MCVKTTWSICYQWQLSLSASWHLKSPANRLFDQQIHLKSTTHQSSPFPVLCEYNPHLHGGLPLQMTCNMESVSAPWRNHVITTITIISKWGWWLLLICNVAFYCINQWHACINIWLAALIMHFHNVFPATHVVTILSCTNLSTNTHFNTLLSEQYCSHLPNAFCIMPLLKAELWRYFGISMKQPLNKSLSGWWFERPSRSYHCLLVMRPLTHWDRDQMAPFFRCPHCSFFYSSVTGFWS